MSLLGASLDVGNRGVLALAVSLAHLTARARPGAEIVFHYGSAEGGSRQLPVANGHLDVTVRNCRMSPRSAARDHVLVILSLALLYRIGLRGPAKRNPWLRSLLDATVIGEIRGGDSFSDIYGVRRFFEGCLPLITVAALGQPYVMLPQTYGPFTRRISRAVGSALLRRASVILTRDANSIEIVRQLSGRTAEFCPDVAFTLEPRQPAQLELCPTGSELRGAGPLIGVNVSGLLYMGGYTGRNMFGLKSPYKDLVDALLTRLLEATPARILLVPHVFGSEQEEEACTALLHSIGGRYPGRLSAVKGPLSEQELKWTIGQTDFFVGSRMHACIAALSQCIPAVGLAYSDKFLGVFESAGVGNAIVDLRVSDASQVIERTLGALSARAALAENLRRHVPSVQAAVRTAFERILDDSATERRPQTR